MLLQVKVHPKARRDNVQVLDDRSLKISVTAPPEGGKANDAVIVLVAKRLGVAKSDVEIVRGHRARDKLVRVHGLTEDGLTARLPQG